MKMDINELADKVGGEIVGGRLLATVDGKKAYLTNVGEDGSAYLNELGLKISNELSFVEAPAQVAPQEAPQEEAATPKRSRRRAEAPAAEPEQLELDF